MEEGKGAQLTGSRQVGIAKLASEIAREITNGSVLGLGSGSTIARVLPQLAEALREKNVKPKAVPTSLQIQNLAEEEGIDLTHLHNFVDLVVDGADQVDKDLNLMKGGGGALLKEKVLMSSSRRNIIVADERKFVPTLGMNSVKVPVEVTPFAREIVKKKIAGMGGSPEERRLPKGYPYFTENGNVIFDTSFEPIKDPSSLETRIKSVPGVVEVGIFTIKPISVYKIKDDDTFELLRSD